jgi:hypothetical protein
MMTSAIDVANRDRRRQMGLSGALSQDTHERINSRWPGLTRQHCAACEAETGRCKDDSLFDEDGGGPFCEECWPSLP